MLSDIAKRNIWLVLSVMAFACVIWCAVNVLDGTAEWWKNRNKTCGSRQSGQ